MVEYFWMIMGACNYRCPYCVYGLSGKDRRRDAPVFPLERCLESWGNLHRKYGEGSIIMTGGEPTQYPGFTELVTGLQDRFLIAFDTNLSWDKDRLAAFLGDVRPGRVRFENSFHPYGTSTEAFVEKARMVRDAGIGYINRLVAYPPLLDRIEEFRAAFSGQGLDFVVNPFRGAYNGRTYPESYTDQEKQTISGATVGVEENPGNAPHKEFVRQMLDGRSPYGRQCRAGQRHVRIEDDGMVYRCVEYSARKWEPLGHFLDGELALLEAPRPCMAKTCEWEYRWLVDQAERFGNSA